MKSYYYKKESKRNNSINMHNNTSNYYNYYNHSINTNNNKEVINNTNIINNNINYYNNNNYINKKDKYIKDGYPHGIINNFDNCSINTGLQIIACCDEIKPLLYTSKSKDPLIIELIDFFNSNYKNYNPIKIINILSQIDEDFKIKGQKCSQNFIRILIKSINQEIMPFYRDINEKIPYYIPENYKETEAYSKFIKSQNIFPESLFSGISKTILYGKCHYCNETIEEYMFNHFIDQSLYLDKIDSNCHIIDILDINLGGNNMVSISCPKCFQENNVREYTKIIKMPYYLIFTLERFLNGINKVSIIPDKIIDIRKFIDSSIYDRYGTQYELFAINIKLGKDCNSGHQICQIKKDGVFFEIDDVDIRLIDNIFPNSYSTDDSYGLFYRKISK